jgi:hypothetical protein
VGKAAIGPPCRSRIDGRQCRVSMSANACYRPHNSLSTQGYSYGRLQGGTAGRAVTRLAIVGLGGRSPSRQRAAAAGRFANLRNPMPLSANAAIAVCKQARQRDLVITRIEGGI